MIRIGQLAFCGVILVSICSGASAFPIVTNGDFTQAGTQTSGDPPGPTGRISTGVSLDWSIAPGPGGNIGATHYNYQFDVAEVLPGNAADTTGATIAGDTGFLPNGNFGLYGPGNGYPNGLSASPLGGNFAALDGDPTYSAYLSQTIHGLTIGQRYQLSYYYAGAQEYAYFVNGPTTMNVTVGLSSLGVGTGQSYTTQTLNNANHGFTGWNLETFDYTATSTSETLWFLASGTPAGAPPISLLANIDLVAVPEIDTSSSVAALSFSGFLLMLLSSKRRKSLPN